MCLRQDHAIVQIITIYVQIITRIYAILKCLEYEMPRDKYEDFRQQRVHKRSPWFAEPLRTSASGEVIFAEALQVL